MSEYDEKRCIHGMIEGTCAHCLGMTTKTLYYHPTTSSPSYINLNSYLWYKTIGGCNPIEQEKGFNND